MGAPGIRIFVWPLRVRLPYLPFVPPLVAFVTGARFFLKCLKNRIYSFLQILSKGLKDSDFRRALKNSSTLSTLCTASGRFFSRCKIFFGFWKLAYNYFCRLWSGAPWRRIFLGPLRVDLPYLPFVPPLVDFFSGARFFLVSGN